MRLPWIPDRIQPQDVIGIAVANDAQAGREISRLGLLGVGGWGLGRVPPPMLVVPEFYDPDTLSRQLRAGRTPREREHRRGATDAR